MQVSVIITPSFTSAPTTRSSSETMARVWPRNAALAKSVPRGSVIVGMRTRRRPSFSAARRSSQRTPASPRLSVSAMTWACVTATQSSAPKKSPTLTWCSSASLGTGPSFPARMSRSSSLSRMARHRSKKGRRTAGGSLGTGVDSAGLRGGAPLMRIAIWLAALSFVGWSASAAAQSELKGLASVSGSVTSPAPFKAAKVYFRNAARRMQYMVYTAGGKYQAVNLLPGNYEMRVEAPHLASNVVKVTLQGGANPPLNATLRENNDDAQIVTLDEMFPPGPGHEYVRNTCIGCHNPNMFGAKAMPAAAWDQYVGMMEKNGAIPRGFSSPQERAALVAYRGKNFGPDAKKRAIRFVHEVPLEEAKLAKAMYEVLAE